MLVIAIQIVNEIKHASLKKLYNNCLLVSMTCLRKFRKIELLETN